MKKSVIFPISSTLNGRIDAVKLRIELHASPTLIEDIEIFNNEIHVIRETEFTEAEITVLDAVIQAHDGLASRIANLKLKEAREFKILEMLDKAHIKHPTLWDSITLYISEIDNYINGFIRTNNSNIIFQKIDEDRVSAEWGTFLNTVINEEGILAYQFFQGVILAAMNV